MARGDNPSRLFGGWRTRLSHIVARMMPVHTAWYNGRPLLSFTFDDFPASAARTAADILQRHKAHATFYAATGLIGQSHDLWPMADASSLVELERMGHEIGLHTHEHRLAWQYDENAFERDLTLNEATIAHTVSGYVAETFAYPYGIGNWTHKQVLSRRVRAARSTHPGINSGLIDLHFLKAYELIDSAVTEDEVASLLDQTVKCGGWLIFVSHDVCDTPSAYGVTPRLLDATLTMARERKIEILPVCEALDVLDVPLEQAKGKFLAAVSK